MIKDFIKSVIIVSAMFLTLAGGVDAFILLSNRINSDTVADSDANSDTNSDAITMFDELKAEYYNTNNIKTRMKLANSVKRICIAVDWEQSDNDDIYRFCKDVIGQEI